jgi:hypothetical protein
MRAERSAYALRRIRDTRDAFWQNKPNRMELSAFWQTEAKNPKDFSTALVRPTLDRAVSRLTL